MKFEKVLFHTSFRELAMNSLLSILELKKTGLKEIVLTSVISREEVGFVPYGGYMKEEEERLRDQARVRFEDWQQTIAEHGVKSKIHVAVGSPNQRILEVAEEEKVDLVVAGRKKRSLMEKVYVGTHILDLLRRSTVPTLMSKYMVEFEWQDESLTRVNDHIFLRPMLATDWSGPSENALRSMVALKGLAEEVLISHVIDDKVAKGQSGEGLARLEQESKQRLKTYCDRLEEKGLAAEQHLAYGQTAPEILRLSRDHKATMIVMGRTGKDWFQEYWLGGVSHRVAELSELPVMIVP